MRNHPTVVKCILWAIILVLCIVAYSGMSIVNATLYLKVPVWVYVLVVMLTAGFMALRFSRNRGRIDAGRYASEIFGAIGFLLIFCVILLPEMIAGLNYYLPGPHSSYTLHSSYTMKCEATDTETNYTRGVAYHYVTFAPVDGADSFRLKLSSRDYNRISTGRAYQLHVRDGALGYPILEEISR